MVTRRFVKLIETRAEKIAKLWLKEIKQSKYTPTYHTFPEETLFERALAVYDQLGYWLSPETKREEIRLFYMDLGRQRFEEGFRLEEVLMALILLKRYLWLEVMSEGFVSINLEVYQVMELNNRVVLYFDRAIFFTTVGFQEAADKAAARF
ncbi:MAG: RsbRD N-terminal domain-containing protein [Candidatus Geothermincolia bacterium]